MKYSNKMIRNMEGSIEKALKLLTVINPPCNVTEKVKVLLPYSCRSKIFFPPKRSRSCEVRSGLLSHRGIHKGDLVMFSPVGGNFIPSAEGRGANSAGLLKRCPLLPLKVGISQEGSSISQPAATLKYEDKWGNRQRCVATSIPWKFIYAPQ